MQLYAALAALRRLEITNGKLAYYKGRYFIIGRFLNNLVLITENEEGVIADLIV